VYLILAIFAATLQNIVNQPRRGHWNGFLTVKAIIEKRIQAPMRYRVLIPWLMKRSPTSLTMYEFWRVILLWVALLCVASYWGGVVAVIWLVFVMSAQIFDTWCYTSETIGITLALMGNPIGAALGIFVHGLSRETVLINGFVYWLATGDVAGGLALSALAFAVFYGVRWYQGHADLYCDRFRILDNIHYLLLKKSTRAKEADTLLFYAPYLHVILIALSLYGAYLTGRIGFVVPVMVLASVTMGKMNEYRLSLAVAVWAAYAIAERIA